MKSLLAISACALLAVSAPAFAQNANDPNSGGLEKNASPNGASPAKQPGGAATQSGKAPAMTEGRSSAEDPNVPGQTGTDKMKPGVNGSNDAGGTTK